jgi:hypothetical protein
MRRILIAAAVLAGLATGACSSNAILIGSEGSPTPRSSAAADRSPTPSSPVSPASSPAFALPTDAKPILSLPGIGDFGWECGGTGPTLTYVMDYTNTRATQQVRVRNSRSTIRRDRFKPGQNLRIAGNYPDTVSWRVRQYTEDGLRIVSVSAEFSAHVDCSVEPNLHMTRIRIH